MNKIQYAEYSIINFFGIAIATIIILALSFGALWFLVFMFKGFLASIA